MDLNVYQQQAMTTCMDSCRNIPYMLFNLQGEVGELSSKIAKLIRKGQLVFNDNQTIIGEGCPMAEIDPNLPDALAGELGDVLWQLSGLCSVLGFRLEDVASHNLAKLASRKRRGVIDGEGDNR